MPAVGRLWPSDYDYEDDNNIDYHHGKLWPWWQVDNRHHYEDDDYEDEIDNNVDDIIIKASGRHDHDSDNEEETNVGDHHDDGPSHSYSILHYLASD